MYKPTAFYTLFLWVCLSTTLAQVPAEISKPILQIQDDNLVIGYDILKSSSRDQFRVWVEVSDSRGYILNAKTLSGDIGENVQGGKNKQIIWDYRSDNIDPDDEIFVQVFAEKISEPEEDLAKPVPEVQSISKGVAILQSAAFPGWGLSRIHKGKPHWIKGVAAYGCLAGSIILNQKAHTSYDQYLGSFDVTESDAFYNDAVQQDKLSKVFAYAAIGIWVADLVWVVLDSSGHNEQLRSHSKGINIRTDYNIEMNVPVIAFTYNF